MLEYRAKTLSPVTGYDAQTRELRGRLVDFNRLTPIGNPKRYVERIVMLALPDTGAVLNLQHDRARPIMRLMPGTHLTPTRDGIDLRAILPETSRTAEFAEGYEAGVYRGLSVEFVATQSDFTRIVDGADAGGLLRVVEAGRVTGAGVVDEPAYPGAIFEGRAWYAEPGGPPIAVTAGTENMDYWSRVRARYPKAPPWRGPPSPSAA